MNTAKLNAAGGVIGYQEGVRDFLKKSFLYMAMALLLTTATAAISLHFTPIVDGKPVASTWQLVAMFATFGMVMFVSFASFSARSPAVVTGVLALYAALTGYTLAPIALQYTTGSLVNTFLAAVCVFGSAAIYGSVTKRDLTRGSTFFVSALFGLIAAMIINLFMQSTMFDYLLSAAGVVLFAGLTAWDIQKLEQLYNERAAKNSEGLAVYGALALYLDFLNLFLFMLRFFGVRK